MVFAVRPRLLLEWDPASVRGNTAFQAFYWLLVSALAVLRLSLSHFQFLTASYLLCYSTASAQGSRGHGPFVFIQERAVSDFESEVTDSIMLVFVCFYPKVTRYVRVFAIANLSVVCNVHAPYSGGLKLSAIFLCHLYYSHPLTSVQNFTEIIPGEPLRQRR